jgi:hypothetical protein
MTRRGIIEVFWDAEVGARVLDEDTWSSVGRRAPDTPEVLAAHRRAVRWRIAAYGELPKRRLATLPAHKSCAREARFIALQQRLLSLVPAFLRTLKAHQKSLMRLLGGEKAHVSPAAAVAFVNGSTTEEVEDLGLEDEEAEKAIDADEEATAAAAAELEAESASAIDLRAELAAG